MALGVLVAGFFYLDQLQRDLMDAKLEALAREATLLAAALSESAVVAAGTADASLDHAAAGTLVQRLNLTADTRALLFDADGAVAVDSRRLPIVAVETSELPPPEEDRGALGRAADTVYEWITSRLPPRTTVPLYTEPQDPRAADFPRVLSALEGTAGGAMHRTEDARLIAIVAAPVQPFRRVQGALLLVTDASDVLESVRNARFAILQAFCIALGITVLLSLYFAGTIARPVRRLARAAERVRAGGGRKVTIPDFTARHDEIGRLSAALRDMTEALWVRMDAIERFAADVAHEVKNPLSSVLSAVDTAQRVTDEEKRAKLLALVGEDVKRLDRLLSQIADASRIDTELARAQRQPVDLGAMAATLAAMHDTAASTNERSATARVANRRRRAVRGARRRGPPRAGAAEPHRQRPLVQPAGRDDRARASPRRCLDRGQRGGRGPRRAGRDGGSDLQTLLHAPPRERGLRHPFGPRAQHFAPDRGRPRRPADLRQPARRDRRHLRRQLPSGASRNDPRSPGRFRLSAAFPQRGVQPAPVSER